MKVKHFQKNEMYDSDDEFKTIRRFENQRTFIVKFYQYDDFIMTIVLNIENTYLLQFFNNSKTIFYH